MMSILEILMGIVFYYIFINPVLIYMICEYPTVANILMGVVVLVMVISIFKNLITKKQ